MAERLGDKTRNILVNGGKEAVGETPTNVNEFKTRYRADSDYKDHIARKWGEKTNWGTGMADIDKKTEHGFNLGYGYKCSGNFHKVFNSRHNAKNAGNKCCSKFRNGLMAFNIPGAAPVPGGGKGSVEDCGYAWTGVKEAWDEDVLSITQQSSDDKSYSGGYKELRVKWVS